MNNIIELQIWQFSLIYLLLLVVALVMKFCKVNQNRLLFIATFRMSVQLFLAGLVLTYLFENPHPLYTSLYLVLMIGFTIYRVLSKHRDLNRRFQLSVGLSLFGSGLAVLCFFIYVVVGESLFNPQYAIPIAGMLMGNSMTGVSLGLKSFTESLKGQRSRINALLCVGATPQSILLPFVRQSFETALLPTMNSMVSMGIVALPGMMTGQILSGTLPSTAILYQIAIMIAICTVVCLATFSSLYFGYRSLCNPVNQTISL